MAANRTLLIRTVKWIGWTLAMLLTASQIVYFLYMILLTFVLKDWRIYPFIAIEVILWYVFWLLIRWGE